MNKLIYNPVQPSGLSFSPFLDCFRKALESDDLCIVCPYICLDYLKEIQEAKCMARLITDAKELVAVNGGNFQDFKNFLRSTYDPSQTWLRSVPGVHAKLILQNDKAILGSANLTHFAFERRHELWVEINDLKINTELRRWFEKLWEISKPILADSLSKPSRSSSSIVDEVVTAEGKQMLKRLAKLRSLPQKNVSHSKSPESTNEYDRLLRVVRKAPSRQWIEKLLVSGRSILVALSLDSSDPRLAVTITQKENRIGVNIGNLRIFLIETTRRRIQLLQSTPLQLEGFDLIDSSKFKSINAELPYINWPSPDSLSNIRIQNLVNTIRDYLPARKRVVHGRKRSDLACRLFFDSDFRTKFLDDAFPPAST